MTEGTKRFCQWLSGEVEADAASARTDAGSVGNGPVSGRAVIQTAQYSVRARRVSLCIAEFANMYQTDPPGKRSHRET
jgi:hypothetical protein